MKTRQAFVANSSSSSFVILSLGDDVILSDGDTGWQDAYGTTEIDIDTLMEKLVEAKKNGIKTLFIEHGGGYDG